MAEGYRSLAAPWIGGAASEPAVTNGGVRSLFAFWIGGAASSPAVVNAGYRGLLAFWAGGAANRQTAPVTPQGGYWRIESPIFDEEVEALILCGAL